MEPVLRKAGQLFAVVSGNRVNTHTPCVVEGKGTVNKVHIYGEIGCLVLPARRGGGTEEGGTRKEREEGRRNGRREGGRTGMKGRSLDAGDGIT